ncbi:MAG TPA: DUF3710 domain-containing protein, partial [Propionibacteriaceae bacterium]|nr:DUF3710 domain-containing protein [Propionibacteriaceae bacterium]
RRNKKQRSEPETVETEDRLATDDAALADDDTAEAEPADDSPELSPADELARLDELEWRADGPWDISEIDYLESTEGRPRIDLGSIVLTGVPGSELRLQVAEETNQIISAMLVIETIVVTEGGGPESYSSALELGAYAAPRSGGLWAELRDDISASAAAEGGSASMAEGPFGVELRRLMPVTTPDGEQGYQPSRMWVAEGPRWLLRGIVYGQAAIEEDLESPVVAEVLDAFRQVVVRRGDEAMAPGDLLPLTMPANATAEADGS